MLPKLSLRSPALRFLSGMLLSVGHEPKFVGRVGKELNVEQARAATYTAALNVLGVAKQHLGSLDKISRVVRLGVYIATAGDFFDPVKIVGAASELLHDIFSEDKISSRLVFGVEPASWNRRPFTGKPPVIQ